MDLTALYLLLLPAALYLRAALVLRRRGYAVPWLQQVAWFSGLVLIGIALLSPLDHLGETDLLSAHMGQHLLIADLAAPLILLGMRSPVYAFLLPRPVLVPLARAQPLRRLLRRLRQPWIAAPLWILILYGWHMPVAYEGALRSAPLHAVQHQSFIIGSLLVWLSVLEPTRRRVPGGLWKIAHITGVRFAGMFLGMAFLLIQRPVYESFYGQRALEHGLSPLEDQQLAGGFMLGLDLLVMIGALCFFFLRTAQDADLAEERYGAELHEPELQPEPSAPDSADRADQETLPAGTRIRNHSSSGAELG